MNDERLALCCALVDELVSPLTRPAHRLRIQGGTIYTADTNRTIIPNGELLALGGAIVWVGSPDDPNRPPILDDTLIDATGSVVMPGLVDTHYHEVSAFRFSHLAGGPLGQSPYANRGFEHGGDLERLSVLLGDRTAATHQLSAEHMAVSTVFGVWQLLQRGVTGLGDFGSAVDGRLLAYTVARMGIRARLSAWCSDLIVEGQTARPRVDAQELLARSRRTAEWVTALDNERLSFMPSAIMLTSSSDELLVGLRSIAKEFATRGDHAPMAVHLAAIPTENDMSLAIHGLGIIERAAQLGLLDAPLIAAHCAYVSEADQAMLKRSATHVTVSPAKYGTSGENVMMQHRLLSMIDDGIPLSFSCDGEIFPNGGPLEAARQGWFHLTQLANSASVLTAHDALCNVTAVPSVGLGWGDQVGTLEAGKRCDVVIAKLADWRGVAVGRPLDSLLVLGGSGDIHTVIADGRILVEDKQPTLVNPSLVTHRFSLANSAALA